MKKMLCLVCALALVLSFAACGTGGGTSTTTAPAETTVESTTAAQRTPVNVAVLKGPTGMGAVKMMADADAGTSANAYTFKIAASPDEIVSAVASGSVDIAACPLNLAANLYKKTSGNVKMLAINTLGVLYILENGNTIKSVADLEGKKIYATGQGSSPEYVLNFILNANGLTPGENVTVEYLSEHSELTALAAAGDADICLLPEPNVTTAMSKNSDLRVALDLTEEWNKVCTAKGTPSELAQGCLIVNAEFAQKNPAAVDVFITEYKASVDYVNVNIDAAAQMIAEREIIPSAALAKKAIPNCNIVCVSGAEMKTIAQQNFEVLFAANPKSVGGSIPDDSLYYIK